MDDESIRPKSTSNTSSGYGINIWLTLTQLLAHMQVVALQIGYIYIRNEQQERLQIVRAEQNA